MNNKKNLELNDILGQLEQIDYGLIISLLSFIVNYYATKKVIDGYRLRKDFIPKNINKISLPPELTQEYSKVDIAKLASQRFGDAVIEFAKLMMDKFPSSDLTNFYNNLTELKIKPKKFGFQNLVLQRNTAAQYSVKDNKIELDENNYITTIYHELFHMASSIYKDGISYSGFSQVSFKFGTISLGNAINEGYTQLLTERYFGYIEGLCRTYKFEVNIADKLEKIIGQEKMENLYLNANLLGLINELKKYALEEEITKFISSTDFLTEHLRDTKILPKEEEMIISSLTTLNKFLISVYAMKLRKQLDNGNLSISECTENLGMYVGSLSDTITIGKNIYNFFTPDDLQQQLESVFTHTNSNIESNAPTIEGRKK